MKWYVRKDYGPILGTVVADSSDEAIEMARARFGKLPWMFSFDARLIQVFNNRAPAPDPSAGDEGRAWWMAHGY